MGLRLLLLIGLLISGCSSSETSLNPSEVIGQFDSAMTSAGNQLNSSSLASNTSSLSALTSVNFMESVDDLCDENGRPMDGGNEMSNSDPDYPARIFYCKIAKNTNSPESIPGAYGLVKNISCALEKAGVIYDGLEHTQTVVFDTDCFSPEDLDDEGMPGTVEITYVGGEPAPFNSSYQRGITLEVPNFGTFALAVNVDGESIAFLTYEDQTSISPNKTGTYAGQFDASTGEIRFEARHDRYFCEEEGNCGWTRHDKIYLKCNSVEDGECVGIEEIQAASSDIFNQSGISGQLFTISGELSVGVRPRYYQYQGDTPDDEDFNDHEKWVENTNSASRCYTETSATEGDCTSNPGIELPDSTFFFALFDGYTSSEAWYQETGILDFTSIDLLER